MVKLSTPAGASRRLDRLVSELAVQSWIDKQRWSYLNNYAQKEAMDL